MSVWPVEIAFPWSLYMSANERLLPRGDRLVSAPEYRNRLEAARLWAENEVSMSPLEGGPVKVVEHVYPPDRRRRDVRNCGKLFEDALEGIVYTDDSQIRDLHMVYHEPDDEEPRIVVTVAPLADGEAG